MTGIVLIKNRLALVLIFWLLAINLNAKVAIAENPIEWSPQQQIPGYDNFARTPYLVADQNRTVHAFTSQWVGEGSYFAVVYSQWTLGEGWTEPNDILLSPSGDARVMGAALDDAGIMHVLFFGGDDMAANIYYSQAPAIEAGKASAWATPTMIGNSAITPSEASLTSDGKGKLVVVYSGNAEGVGLYAVQSNDSGRTWTDSIPLAFTYDTELLPSALKTYSDGLGNVHAVWAVANRITGNGETVYYAKLESGEIEWSEPLDLAHGNPEAGIEVDTPSIIEYENELFLIYHDNFPTTRHMLRSRDGGQTWTEKVRLFPHVGSNGPASLVIDSNNTLHMFFGNRVTGKNQQIVQGMWHSIWQGGGWSTPDAVVSGPAVHDEIGGDGFDPSFANAIIRQGNVILVTWRSDPAAGLNGAWYSYATLDAPELPAAPLPTQPTATSSPSAMPIPSPSPRQVFLNPDIDLSAAESIGNPMEPLIIGGAVVALFIVVVVIGRGVLLSRRHEQPERK